MANTLREIIDEVYDILWEDHTSTIFDRTKKVVPEINRTILKICKGQIINRFSRETIRAWMLSFLHKEEIVAIPKKKKVKEEVDKGSMSMQISDTEWLPILEGSLFVMGRFYDYINIQDKKINLKNPIEDKIPVWTELRFALKKDIETIKYRDVRELDTNKTLLYYDFQETPIYNTRSYTIVPYQNCEYLVFSSYVGNVIVPIIIKPSKISNDKAVCILPDEYGVDVVAKLVAGNLLMKDQQLWAGQNALIEWYDNLIVMYNFYAKPVKNRRERVKTRPMNFNFY